MTVEDLRSWDVALETTEKRLLGAIGVKPSLSWPFYSGRLPEGCLASTRHRTWHLASPYANVVLDEWLRLKALNPCPSVALSVKRDLERLLQDFDGCYSRPDGELETRLAFLLADVRASRGWLEICVRALERDLAVRP